MSAAADPRPGDAPAGWEHLERAVEDAVAAVATWRVRALHAECEVSALRTALEERLGAADEYPESTDHLRAENVALHSRINEARRRMQALHGRLRILEERR